MTMKKEYVYCALGAYHGVAIIGCHKGSPRKIRHRCNTSYGVSKITAYRCTNRRATERRLHGYLWRYYIAKDTYSLACLPDFHRACRILCNGSHQQDDQQRREEWQQSQRDDQQRQQQPQEEQQRRREEQQQHDLAE